MAAVLLRELRADQNIGGTPGRGDCRANMMALLMSVKQVRKAVLRR